MIKIGCVGMCYDHDFVAAVEFRSEISFLEYDILIIDFKNIIHEYKTDYLNSTYRGYRCLNDDDSSKLREDIERRKNEIIELLKMGRTIVFYTPSNTRCYAATGTKGYSGTGKNRSVTRHVDLVDVTSIIPIDIKIEKSAGKNMEYIGIESYLKDFWKKNAKHISYQSYLKNTVGKPFLKIKGTDKIIGTIIKIDKGNLLLMP